MIDNNIVEKAKDGNIHAFEEIFKKTNKGIYNFILNLSSNRELADDLTQETYIRAFRSIKSLKSKDSINSWLHRIALNLYRDEIKKPKLNIKSIDDNSENNDIIEEITDWTRNPENIITDDELQHVVKNAIQSLPEIHRAVVTMHHIEGMEIDDIAKVLKTSNGTVMSRLARARDSLRRKLAFYEGKK
ncbi:TPA: sigma-70 family RNA polymerase sigma factor [bacterium]|nr:sigma-70 family RNA polymerase sigma factor [bacterium]